MRNPADSDDLLDLASPTLYFVLHVALEYKHDTVKSLLNIV